MHLSTESNCVPIWIHVAGDKSGPDRDGQMLLRLVAAASRISETLLLHEQRCRREIARARQLAMYLMHVVLQRDYSETGQFFGRDRTTVAYACALIEDLREDPDFDEAVSRLEEALEHRHDDVPPEQDA